MCSMVYSSGANTLGRAGSEFLWNKRSTGQPTIVFPISSDISWLVGRVRTSSGMFLSRGQDDVVTRIEHRIARVSGVPFENGESLQILHYGAQMSSTASHMALSPHYVDGPTSPFNMCWYQLLTGAFAASACQPAPPVSVRTPLAGCRDTPGHCVEPNAEGLPCLLRRAVAEVRAALRLLPRRGECQEWRPAHCDNAHVPVGRAGGRRDRLSQLPGETGDALFWPCVSAHVVHAGHIKIIGRSGFAQPSTHSACKLRGCMMQHENDGETQPPRLRAHVARLSARHESSAAC